MRISTNMIFEQGVFNMNTQLAKLARDQEQISTGRRVLTPADDPVAAARALEVSQAQSINKQYLRNADSAISAISQNEGILSTVTANLTNLRTIVVNAGSGVNSPDDLKMIASEVRGLYAELLALGNATDGNGQYLYSGYQGSTQPFVEAAPGSVIYNGDEGQRKIQISASRQAAVSDSGADIFTKIRNGNRTFVTAANVTNSGSGIISPGTVLDKTAWNSAANNKNFTIKFDVNNATFPATTTYDIIDNVSGNSLLTGAAAAASGPYLRTYIADTAINLKTVSPPDTTATPFDYGAEVEIKGAPATGDSFTVNASSDQDIYTTVWNLVTALESANIGAHGVAVLNNALNATSSNISNALDNVLTVRASVGARMKEIDTAQNSDQDADLQYSKTLSALQDLDYAKAISDLTKEQTSLDAAQKSFAKITSLSLFNYV
jgi:flagellar hook-associated protein 3 FlgL